MTSPDGRTPLPRRLLLLVLLAALALFSTGAQARATPPQWDHDWARGAVFYEVFVRSFQDSDADGIGDFRGLTARLDYLQDLGVDALWLMPVFLSPSYHGYDTIDYERIEPGYGTGADFDKFLAEAHRRGIKVILDLVLNHTSNQHPWFVDAASSPKSGHRNWYVWRGDDPGWTQPWGSGPTWHHNDKDGQYFYGIFWGGMPDLNYDEPAVREEMKRIATHWLARGVDGFRLDASRHLFANGPGPMQNDQPQTHAYLKELAAAVRQAKPQAVMVGENAADREDQIAPYFGSTAQIAGGDELPMSFDFPLAKEILDGVNAGEASGLGARLEEVNEAYPPGVIDTPFLTNHDQTRLATQLGNDPAKLRLAAAILLTLPGAPFLYYGEELGLQNGPGGPDPFKRTPMPWDATPNAGFTTAAKPWFDLAPGWRTANVAAETGDPASLLSHYRRLIHLRHASPALRKGTLTVLSPTRTSTPVLAFLRNVRDAPGERVLVLHNLGTTEIQAGPYDLKAGSAERLFGPSDEAVKGAEGWTFHLPAGASGAWRLKQGS
ncbi:MAG TPA: alpha-amylase family glycosyl hydrolase [Thermoanaerobaculia bacterium]|jgi:glycosidase|nr:alpha-amylase family glycosyl hydrolase [Thermoanaerobaculia bacterium]